jgi:radical SAM protein with 4Fe4S-binding SPASM domain
MKSLKKVYIEISNICNLQCSFCPEVERDNKVMSYELFEKTLEEVVPITSEVALHLMGEPLNHPQILGLLALCEQKNIPVNLTTNGTLINKFSHDDLLMPIIRQINFSLHSFRSNFPSGDMGKYLNPIFNFVDRALEKRPELYINYRLWNMEHAGVNENDEILNAVDQHYKCQINRNVDVGFRKGKRITERLSLHFDSRFEWPSLQSPFLSKQGRCHALSSHIGILADGMVVPCCLDKEALIPLGNLQEKPIKEILQTPRATAMLKGFQNGQRVEDLCQRCSFVERFK